VTYPRPPDFTGTAFLEQLLISLTTKPQALKVAPDAATFADVTAPLWHYLDTCTLYFGVKAKIFRPRQHEWMYCSIAAPCVCH
jgi:putative thiamine transport system substrate-binding protein